MIENVVHCVQVDVQLVPTGQIIAHLLEKYLQESW